MGRHLSVNRHSPPNTAPPAGAGGRGGGWVWVQSILMTALVIAGPVDAGTWHHPLGVGSGAILFAAAGAVGIAGVVQLGDNRTPFPRPRPGSRLVERGVYGWVRHPLYVSVLLAGFGWALLWQSIAALAAAALQVPFFAAKAAREERWLCEAFPHYPEYARRVKRFVPGIY